MWTGTTCDSTGRPDGAVATAVSSALIGGSNATESAVSIGRVINKHANRIVYVGYSSLLSKRIEDAHDGKTETMYARDNRK